MSSTKKNRYENNDPHPVIVPADPPLLKRLRSLQKKGKSLALRDLMQEPYNIPSIEIQLLAREFPAKIRVDATPDGRSHFVTLLDPAQATTAMDTADELEPGGEPALEPTAAPLLSGEVPTPIPTPKPLAEPQEHVDGQGGHHEERKLASDPIPGMLDFVRVWVPDPPDAAAQAAQAAAQANADAEYNATLTMLRGDRTITARHGGTPGADRRRVRRPMVDINTGESLALANAAAKHDYSKPIGKRYSDKRIRQMRVDLAKAGNATPAKPEPHPMRHKQAINGAGQRREDAVVVRKASKTPDLVLKHHLEANRRPVSRQIDSVNPHPAPPLPVG